MREWLLDRFLERSVGPGRPLPRWARALLDETFLWVALGQLLLALGVRRESVRRLSEVQAVLEEARRIFGAAGYEVPRLEGLRTLEDVDRFMERLDELETLDLTSVELERIVPAATLVRWMQGSGLIVLDLLEEVLDRLRARRIRTALIGLDHASARTALLRARRLLDGFELEEIAAEGGYPAVARRLEELEAGTNPFADLDVEARPVAPRPGEVGRIVEVIRAIPRPTLDRLLPLRLLSSRIVLSTAISRALARHREQWVPPGERPAPAEHDDAARPREDHRRWMRRRRAFYREVDAHDARPEVRRSLLVQTALLGGLSAVVLGWSGLLVATGVFGAGLPAEQEAHRAVLTLWPALLLASLAALGLSFGSASIGPVDRIELEHVSLRSAAESTPARRARRLAVRLAEVAGFLVFVLPWVVGFLLAAPEMFHLDGRRWWPGVEAAGPWVLAAALGLPWIASLLGVVIGNRRGVKSMQERWSRLDPEGPSPTI